MKFERALAMMRNGEKVRLTEWKPEEYIEIDDGRFIDETGGQYFPPYFVILSEKWELFVEPHDFAWAVEQLRSGKKVRRGGFISDEDYIVADGVLFRDQDGGYRLLDIRDIVATDWTLAP